MTMIINNRVLCLGILAILFGAVVASVSGQLVVNFRSKGGETLVEEIIANTSSDTVSLEFVASDGTLVTQFIDFKSEIQIFRLYILGEEELGQNPVQTVCFLTRFMRNDFISSDAMSKLRQKNPTAIRTPEEEKEMAVHSMDHTIALDRAQFISPHIFNICSVANDGIYAQEMDLRTISKSLAKDYMSLMNAASESNPNKHPRCDHMGGDANANAKPCTCQTSFCIGWYPCGLKFCHGIDTSGRAVSYRCGIKTCKRCQSFIYVASSRLKCV